MIFDDDFTINDGESLFVPSNKILINSGVLLIEGILDNRGEIENKGNILFSSGGAMKNLGTVNSICENL